MGTNSDREPARAEAEIQQAMDAANRLTEKLVSLMDRQAEVENNRSAYDSDASWEAAVEAIEREYGATSEEEREAEAEFQRTMAYWNEDDEYDDEDEDEDEDED